MKAVTSLGSFIVMQMLTMHLRDNDYNEISIDHFRLESSYWKLNWNTGQYFVLKRQVVINLRVDKASIFNSPGSIFSLKVFNESVRYRPLLGKNAHVQTFIFWPGALGAFVIINLYNVWFYNSYCLRLKACWKSNKLIPESGLPLYAGVFLLAMALWLIPSFHGPASKLWWAYSEVSIIGINWTR